MSELTTLTTRQLNELRRRLDDDMSDENTSDDYWVACFMAWCDVKTELQRRNHREPLPEPRQRSYAQ